MSSIQSILSEESVVSRKIFLHQEGLFYEDFKRQPKSETAYRKDYMKWAAKNISGKVRGIEYCKKPSEIAYVKAYYSAHGWDVYISKHKNLEGD